MKKNALITLVVTLLIGAAWTSSAQEVNEEYDYNSLRPIRKSDKMYANTLWYRMDMREKQNEAFFAEGNQITQIIVDAVKAGVLRPFATDDLQTRMSLSEFLENLKLPSDGGDDPDLEWPSEEETWPSDGDGWPGSGDGLDDTGAEIEGAVAVGDDEFLTKQMPIIELKTQLVFDKKRSRMYREIESITIVIPGDYYPSGIDKKLATFSYKELVENVFQDNPTATWYNSQNTVEHRNLADAFDLALESAQLIRYANPRDAYIEDIYNGNLKVALGKSQEYVHGLLEKESNTWSN